MVAQMRCWRVACLISVFSGSAFSLKLRSVSSGGEEMEQQDMKVFLDNAYAHLVDATKQLQLAMQELGQMGPAAVANSSNHSKTNVSAASAKPMVQTTPKGNASLHENTTAKKALVSSKRQTLLKEQENLKDLFQHLKLNIGKFNKDEVEGKDGNKQMIEQSQKRLAEDKKKLNSSHISQFEHDLLVNHTRMDERSLQYWTRGRAIQHDMFHANLRMTHGLMARVKTVMEAYGQLLNKGKVDLNIAKELQKVATVLPKALIEMPEE